MFGPLLDVQMSFRVAGARDCAPCQKWAKKKGFCGISKNDGKRGTCEQDLQDASSVAGAVQETCSSELLGGPGADFLRGVAFWSIRSSVLGRWFCDILRDRCSTSYDLASLLSWQAQYFRQVEWKHRKTHWYEAVSSALNFPFLKDVSQNCFSFDDVKFENWGSLTDLFRFWCCQDRKLRKSRIFFSFLTLSSSKNEEVSQNSCVFKLADRQIDR